MAIELGITEKTLSMWETEKNPPPGDKLLLLARMYQCRPESLLRMKAVA